MNVWYDKNTSNIIYVFVVDMLGRRKQNRTFVKTIS